MLAIDHVQWRAPRALSSTAAAVPQILSFGTDDFMDELATTLAAGTAAVSERIARRETWRDIMPNPLGFPAVGEPEPTAFPKLYQPAHGRFYLVAAHLVCRRYGYPDRRMGSTETASFVVRRLDPVTGAEHAWKPEGSGGTWQTIAPGSERRLVDDEQLLPMAPTAHEYKGRRTRLLTGLVPVGARERYEAASIGTPPVPPVTEDDPLTNPYLALVTQMVVQPLHEVGRVPPFSTASTADQRQAVALALVDLLAWGDSIGASRSAVADGFEAVSTVPADNWNAILADIGDIRDDVLNGELGGVAAVIPDPGALARSVVEAVAVGQAGTARLVSELADLIPAGIVLPEALRAPAADGIGGAYVFRCVYQRTDCPHDRDSWVSLPTNPFHLAGFFDPDAPARPSRIALPFDTSPTGLRNFPRSVSVTLSKQLRGQMDRVKGIDDINGGSTFDLGMLCSLSIPIITICALILLMIMVAILNIVFWWMPFFKICRPVTS